MEKVTALLADAEAGQNEAAQLYNQTSPIVEFCAAVHDAPRLMELLRAGLRPQVLVLDAALPGGAALPQLLRLVRMVDPAYRPHIVATLPPVRAAQYKNLLTLDVDSIIFKPYTLRELFNAVCAAALQEPEYRLYILHTALQELLCRLQAGIGGRGAAYLEDMMRLALLPRQDHTLGELYAAVSARQQLSVGAVISAIGRLTASVNAADTPARAALCAANGLAPDARLTNGQLVYGVEEYLRRTLRL